MSDVLASPTSLSILKIVQELGRSSDQTYSAFTHPDKEFLWFRANPSFGFPASDLQDLHSESASSYVATVNFMGLFGPSSPLPDYFTQAVIDEIVQVESEEQQCYWLFSESELRKLIDGRMELSSISHRVQQRVETQHKVVISAEQFKRLKRGDAYEEVLKETQRNTIRESDVTILIYKEPSTNLRDFFDLFNHRLTSLYIESACKYHSYREFLSSCDKQIERLLSLIGAPEHAERAHSHIDWVSLLRFSSLLLSGKESSEILCKVIGGYFSLGDDKVIVDEGVLNYSDIDPDQQNRLGKANTKLGLNFSLGNRVPDRSGRFRLNLLNLDEHKFKSFLPGNPYNVSDYAYFALHQLIEFLKPAELIAEVALHLAIPSLLGLSLNKNNQTVLGGTSWLAPSIEQPRHVVI